jgi:hypothetical protein
VTLRLLLLWQALPGARPPGSDRSPLNRDAKLKAFGDPVRAIEEVRRGCRRADVMRSLGKDLEPSIEMRRIDRQEQVGHHRLAVT